MKLLDKSTRYYLVYSLFVLTIGSLFFYFSVQHVIKDGIDEALRQEKKVIVDNLNYENNLDSLNLTNVTFIQKLKGDSQIEYEKYYSVEPSDSLPTKENYRQLESIFKHDGVFYLLKIRQSLKEEEELVASIVPIGVVMFLILLVGVLIISNFISARVWAPFYDIIGQLRGYDIKKGNVIQYNQISINEFDQLLMDLHLMTEKINNDYVAQKEFHENFSHELQTPLAIIQNNIELLIQSPNLKEEEMGYIASVMEALKRLSNINRGLVLLAQLDNNQYHEKTELEINKVVNKLLEYFGSKLALKNIAIRKDFQRIVVIKANPILADILITNVVSNAIKHNIENGYLNIEISNNFLKISNSGLLLIGDKTQVFQRFKKFSSSEKSVGLGMAIVKKICDLYGFKISYHSEGTNHEVVINFD
jgi:signal transduction histidine kinase